MKSAKLLMLLLALCLGSNSESSGQGSKDLAAAPAPAQISAARRIFVGNAGGESTETITQGVALRGGPDRAYNEFYAEVKNLGRYELVTAPGDADLVFEIGWAFTAVGLKEWQEFNPIEIRPPVVGELRLVVIDPKTHITLWTISEYIRGAALLNNRDKNFDEAMNRIMSRLQRLLQPIANTANVPAIIYLTHIFSWCVLDLP